MGSVIIVIITHLFFRGFDSYVHERMVSMMIMIMMIMMIMMMMMMMMMAMAMMMKMTIMMLRMPAFPSRNHPNV